MKKMGKSVLSTKSNKFKISEISDKDIVTSHVDNFMSVIERPESWHSVSQVAPNTFAITIGWHFMGNFQNDVLLYKSGKSWYTYEVAQDLANNDLSSAYFNKHSSLKAALKAKFDSDDYEPLY